MKNWILAGCLIVAAGWGGGYAFAESAGAEEEGLEALLFAEIPVVISQGFFSRKTTQSPGYATVISAAQIENSPAMILPDLIDYYVPGMATTRHEAMGPTFGVRGIVVDSNAKTLFMLDGQHLNHRQHFGYSNELRVPLLGDIASLEVVNGPGAIVHGSGAISGFINMIPKNGTAFKGLTANVTGGFEESLFKAEVGYGSSYGERRDLYLYAGVVQAEGTSSDKPWDSSNSNFVNESLGNTIFNLAADTQTSSFFSPTYKVGAYWNHEDFHLNVFMREENAGMNGTGYSPTNPGGETPQSHSASFGIRPKWTFKASETESVDFLGSLLWMEHGANPDEDFAGPLFGASENHKEIKVVGKSTRFAQNSLAAGFSYGKRDFEATDVYFGDDVEGNWEGNTGDWDEISIFGEDVIDFTEALVGSLGVRYDKATYGEVTTANNYQLPDTSNTSMRAALAYSFDENTSMKLSYQEGFRYLDMAYMYWFSVWSQRLVDLGYTGLAAFEPETMSSVELNFSKKFPDMKVKFDVNLFNNKYEDMLAWKNFSPSSPGSVSPAGVQAILNNFGWFGSHTNAAGDFSSQGIELAMDLQLSDRLLFRGSYSYSEPTDVSVDAANSIELFTNDQEEWLRFPDHILKGTLAYGASEDALKLSLTTLYESGTDIGKVSQAIAPIYEDDRIIVDVAGEYTLTENFSIKLTVKNLFESDVPEKTFKLRPYMGAMGQELRYIYLTAKLKLA